MEGSIDALSMPSPMGNVTFVNKYDDKRTIKVYTGEQDLIQAPPTANVLLWQNFRSDMYSTDRSFSEVEEICELFKSKLIDLRPYIIEEPYTVYTTDRLTKVLEMIRHMHLRALPVVDPNDGTPVAVITRSDLFDYL